MAAEREIKTVLTLEDASFSKGLKAATKEVSAYKAQMAAAVNSAITPFGKALSKVKGLSKILKAQKSQMTVLSKEYKAQTARLKELQKQLQEARKAHGEDSAEVKKAANAYATQAASVNDLREKMAKLQLDMARNRRDLTQVLTTPFRMAANAVKTLLKVGAAALVGGAAALVKFTGASNEAKKDFNTSLAESRGTFQEWSLFLEKEAESAWKSLGLSQAAYLATAADIGQKLQEAGMPVQQSAEWVSQAMALAGQLSEKYGVPVETVLADISEAASGNTDALKKYGVTVAGINKSMTNSQKASATLTAALSSVDTSVSQFGSQVQTVSTATESLQAAWTNFKAGVGSEEDVAAAAAGWASTFATDFTSSLSTMINIAPDFFSSFAASFKNGWEQNVWPSIQDLFSKQFNIDLPDWKAIMKGISETWATVKARIAGFFEKPFGIELPDFDTLKKSIEDLWKRIKESVKLSIDAVINTVTNNANELDNSGNFRLYPQPFAGGLNYVPQDNYMARLHRGEMVLTADQARRYRANAAAGNTYNDTASIYIDKYNQYSGADVQAILNQMQAMQRRQRMGYGLA